MSFTLFQALSIQSLVAIAVGLWITGRMKMSSLFDYFFLGAGCLIIILAVTEFELRRNGEDR